MRRKKSLKLDEDDIDCSSSSNSDDEDKLTMSSFSLSSSSELKSSSLSKVIDGREEAFLRRWMMKMVTLLMRLVKVATKARITAPHLQKLKAMETDWIPLKEVVVICEGKDGFCCNELKPAWKSLSLSINGTCMFEVLEIERKKGLKLEREI